MPTSTNEVYDDDFELLWPEDYASIGSTLGGASVLEIARKPGDLQFLCTDTGTSRNNRITHVAMVANEEQIVHARGTRYGVCTNELTLYAGKVCAVCRYNPDGILRTGMKGFRTLALQQALNLKGANLSEDGEYGSATADAVRNYQTANSLDVTGEANQAVLTLLGLQGDVGTDPTPQPSANNLVRITGGTVNIRTGPGTQYASVKIATLGETFSAIDMNGWRAVQLEGAIRWVSEKYSEIV